VGRRVLRGAPTGCPPTEWFGDCAPTQDSVLQLLEAHYRVSIPNFWAIIAPATENWYYILGDVQKGASPSCGEYAVAGTGTSIFRGLVNETRLREGDILSTDLTALRLANELLAREIITGETIHALFGGGYEVLYRDSHGFQRIDDVLHIFSQIFVTNDGFCENFLLYAHQIRQWYEEDRLYLVSLSLTDEARQGLPSKGFVVPGVLGQEIPPTCVPDFTKRPKYVCVHQQFEFQGRKIPCNLALRGESIDKYFIIGKADSNIRFEFTSLYRDWVHDFCRRIATTCAGTSV
jgi:hypothetical protein